MKSGSKGAQYQAPLMSAFREAFEARDSREKASVVVDGERVIEGRRSRQRRGDESMLKRDLSVDLVSLMNTINLASVQALDSTPYVRDSVLNYGLPDITHMTSEEAGVDDIRDQIVAALKNFEPRIISDTIHVDREDLGDDTDQRVRFTISCEMFCSPVDVGVDFVAELEISSGKINLARLPHLA